jgi:NADH:ubiquinone oxidoreductase subunit 4 (subunit M)
MLVATVFSLAYMLRFVSYIFFGQPKDANGQVIPDAAEEPAHGGHGNEPATETKEGGHAGLDVPNYIKLSFAILVVLVVIVGIYPSFFIHLIQTVSMG